MYIYIFFTYFFIFFVKDGTVTFWSKTERGIKAETRLQNHPYDTESWGVLIREAQVLKNKQLVIQRSQQKCHARCKMSTDFVIGMKSMKKHDSLLYESNNYCY